MIRDSVIDPKPVAKQIMVDKEIATELITSWKEPTWVVEAEPLDKFAVLLERRYNVEIEFHAEEIKKLQIYRKNSE
ncbi:MAG: DUF4974 domain-containing protein [Bacteroidetes bacterium]|nr:DUF4974 domain-containing protein [Bacteroidota bacterium]